MPSESDSKPATPPLRTPFETIQQRAAEAIPGLAVLAHIVGVKNVKRLLADAAQRTRDGHKAMARAAGMEGVLGAGDDMGDSIIITGDVTTSHEPAPPQQPNTAASRLAGAALLLAGVFAGGLGGPLLVNWLSSSKVIHEIKKMEPQEFEVTWRIKDGKLEKNIKPVEPSK